MLLTYEPRSRSKCNGLNAKLPQVKPELALFTNLNFTFGLEMNRNFESMIIISGHVAQLPPSSHETGILNSIRC